MSEVNGARSLVAAIAVALLLTGCISDESRADRLYRDAAERVDAGEFGAAVERLDRILADYPETEAASRARREVELYRGLERAVRSYPMRLARDRMVQIARAIESHRNRERRYPGALSDLVPARIREIPDDPWGRPFLYTPTREGRGYRLECLGEDGVRGGEGDAADLVVVNGRFVEEPAE